MLYDYVYTSTRSLCAPAYSDACATLSQVRGMRKYFFAKRGTISYYPLLLSLLDADGKGAVC